MIHARCPVLVERDEELRALSALASGVAAGAGWSVAVITGEAGAGKSRLAQEFAASLPDGWSAHAVRITRTGALLPALPDGRPLVLVLDDAHFLDPSAVDALAALTERQGSDRVLALLTFRLGVHRAGSAELRALAGLVRRPRAHELRLAPLSPAGIEGMAAAMGRRASAELHRRTGGNPFWIEEVLRADDRVPWTVVESVTAQLDALPPAARDLACGLAVAEEPVPAGASARLVPDLDGACAALRDAGLAQDGGLGIALRHALVGEAIQARLGPAERAGWHARLAAALEGEPVAPDRLARHLDGAGQTGRAAAIARDAAPSLQARGATRRAFECFRLAVKDAGSDRLAAAGLHEEAALTAARIREHEAMRDWLATAERLYREAGHPDRAVRMLLDPTFDYLPVGRSRAIRDEPVERLLADALAALARADGETARRLIDGGVDAARSRGDGMALARAARMVLFGLGEFERGETLLDEAAACADVAGHPARRSRVLTIRACARYAQGYPVQALELLRQGAAVSRQEPEAVLWTGHLALADVLMLTGRVEEGAAMLGDAGRARWTDRVVAVADGYRRFEAGDVDGGIAEIVRGTDGLLTELDFDPLGRAVAASRVLLARSLAEVNGGHPQAALETVRRLDALSPEPFNDVAADLAYVQARAAAALGAADALEEARARVGAIARVATGPNVLGAVEAVRGFAAVAGGRPDEAERRFQGAAALYERAPRALVAAELWCDAALAAGPGRAAAASLDRAARLGAGHGLDRISARVAAAREALAAAPARRSEALAQLTSREREVALLAADGLSNREIGARLYLAEGTVRNYLSTAFDKLGVARRVELARLVAAVQSDRRA